MPRPENTQSREAILAVARDLMHEAGYNGVSMADIAAAAGIKKANLFHYYSTKEALAVAVFDSAVGDFHERFRSLLWGDPVDAVGRIFDSAAEMMYSTRCARGCFVGKLAQEVSGTNEVLGRRAAETFRTWRSDVENFLEQARASGSFHAGFDPRAAAEAIVALFEGAMLLAKTTGEPTAIASAKAMATAFLRASRA